jgi:CheY-like chemotaxis protein
MVPARSISKAATINLYTFREIGNIGRPWRWRHEDAARRAGARREGEQHVLGQTSGTVTQGHRDRGSGEELARCVLVVEDDALICLDTADALERQGFVVHTALTAEVALRGLRDGLAVDILFTDINLPGAMDGTALARAARELLPELTVVYTSGTVEAVGNAVAGSVFVPKPYNPEQLGRMLGKMGAPSLVA